MRTKATATIYLIESDKRSIYIGSTIKSADKRFQQHLGAVRHNRHPNDHFKRVVQSEGLENVRVKVLEVVPEHIRFNREYFWIDKYMNDGYPLTNIVRKGHPYYVLFIKHQRKVLECGIQFAERYRRWDYKEGTDIVNALMREAQLMHYIKQMFVDRIDEMCEMLGSTEVLAAKYVMTQLAAEPLRTMLCQPKEQQS